MEAAKAVLPTTNYRPPPRRVAVSLQLSGHERPARRAQGARIFWLTLGYYRRGRGFADRVFADWRFTDGPLTNWRGLDNRLRMREIRSNRRSHQSQRRSANDYEFQHEAPVAIGDEPRINQSLRSLQDNN
jgi:hypothetical protein